MARTVISSLPTHLTKAVGVIEISEPAGQLSLSDRRLFNFLLAHAYPSLGKRPNYTVRLSDIRGFAALATLLHGSAAVAGQGSIGAGWNPVNNREPRGAIQTPRRASSSYPETALSGHERAGI